MNTPASFFSFKRFNVPVAGEHPLKVTGNFVTFLEATGPFEFRFGQGGEWLPSQLGIEFRYLPGELFTELNFRQPEGTDPGADPVVIELNTGVGQVNDRRLNIVRQRPNQLFLQAAPTLLLATPLAGDQLAGTTGQNLFQARFPTGNPEGVSYRKAVLVSNLDPTSSLLIRTTGGDTLLAVPAAQVIELETSDDLEVFNPNGSPVSCRIGEIFYLAT